MTTLTTEDIAQIYDALGRTEQAAVLRYANRPDPDALTVEDLAASIQECIDAVPEPTRKASHDSECWKKHAHCLAEKITELLPS
jgi:Glu-tRNA(Gln) amidotransferase subunit E-like FAD-binding protein